MPTFNTDALYKLVQNGVCQGQKIVNIHYYRLAADLVPGDFNYGGAEQLASLWKDYIWASTLNPFTNGISDFLPTSYTLQDITVYPCDNDLSPLFQLPYTLSVGESGLSSGIVNGVANTAILRYNLAPLSFLSGFEPPRSGYLAWGPLPQEAITADGKLETAWQDNLEIVGNILSQTLTGFTPPVTFVPVRLKQTRVTNPITGETALTLNGWSDVIGCAPRTRTSFRRSRVPAAE